MGQYLQGGKNGRLMSFFFKSRAFVWPNLMRKPRFLNSQLFLICFPYDFLFFWFLSSLSRTQARAVWSLGDKRATNHHHRQWHQLQTYEKQLRIEKTRLSHQVWSHGGSTLKKKRTLNGHFSRPAETDPYEDEGRNIKRTIYFHSSHVIFAQCLVFSLISIWLQWPLVLHISRVIPRI